MSRGVWKKKNFKIITVLGLVFLTMLIGIVLYSQKAKNEKLQIAKKMLTEKIDINTIIKITELTKEEIERL